MEIKTKIRKIFTENILAKILALFFAFLLWIYVMAETNPTITRVISNVPIEIKNVQELSDEGLTIKNDTDFKTNVRISGRNNLVRDITNKDIVAYADITGFRNVGVNNIPVVIEDIDNIDILTENQIIRVELEEIIRKQKSVDIELLGSPKEGYLVGDIKSNPSKVWVEGPKSKIENIDTLKATIDINDLNENSNEFITLIPMDSSGKEIDGVVLEKEIVEIIIPIEISKSIPIEPNIDNIEVKDGYRITNIIINPKFITVRGHESILNDLDYINTEPINLEDLDENISKNIGLEIPPGVIIEENRDININIRVQEIKEKNFIYSLDDITIINLDEEYEISEMNLNQQIIANFFIEENLYHLIEKDDIEIILDMRNIRDGEFNIPLEYKKNISISDERYEYDIILPSVNVVVEQIEEDLESEELEEDLETEEFNDNEDLSEDDD